MKIEKITLSLMLGLLLVGCDSRIDAVNEQMASIRNQSPYRLNRRPCLHQCQLLIIQPTSSKALFYQALWLLNYKLWLENGSIRICHVNRSL